MLMTISQLEKATGVKRGTLYVWANRGKIIACRLSETGDYLYSLKEVQAAIGRPRARRAAALLTLRADAETAANIQVLQAAYGGNASDIMRRLIAVAAAHVKNSKNHLTTQNK